MEAQCLAHCGTFKKGVTSPTTTDKGKIEYHTAHLVSSPSMKEKSIRKKDYSETHKKWSALGGEISANSFFTLPKFFTMR